MRAGAVLLALLVLPACGFTPMYATHNNTSIAADLSMLDVKAPENDLGRALKYNLLDLLSPTGNPPANALYRVELAPTLYEEDVAIERDADVTRKNAVLVVPFRLVDVETGKPVMRSVARSRTSYNRVTSEFANITASRDAQARIARDVAADIKMQLGVHFSSQPGVADAAL